MQICSSVFIFLSLLSFYGIYTLQRWSEEEISQPFQSFIYPYRLYPAMDIRKILVILVIAVLFSILVFTTIDAFYPDPDYSDFCRDRYYEKPRPVGVETDCESLDIDQAEADLCIDEGGMIRYDYQAGCPVDWNCDYCQKEYDTARSEHAYVVFIVSAIASLIAIVLGLWLPKSNTLNEWVGTGFMLGGLISLFFGTIRYFGDLNRAIRPVVILLELLIVIYVTYKKLGPQIKKK